MLLMRKSTLRWLLGGSAGAAAACAAAYGLTHAEEVARMFGVEDRPKVSDPPRPERRPVLKDQVQVSELVP